MKGAVFITLNPFVEKQHKDGWLPERPREQVISITFIAAAPTLTQIAQDAVLLAIRVMMSRRTMQVVGVGGPEWESRDML